MNSVRIEEAGGGWRWVLTTAGRGDVGWGQIHANKGDAAQDRDTMCIYTMAEKV